MLPGTMQEDPAAIPPSPAGPVPPDAHTAPVPATLRARLQHWDRRLRQAIAERPVAAAVLATLAGAVLTQLGTVALRRTLAARAVPALQGSVASSTKPSPVSKFRWPAFGWRTVAALPDRRRRSGADDGGRSFFSRPPQACRVPRRHNPKGHSMLEQAQGTVNEIAGKVQGAFGRATNDTAHELEGQARETMGKAQQVYGEALDHVRETAVKNPLGTIAVAAGIGLVVGMLCSRR
jgi:uncharacterized protein YjbJ (UPF0337 family)